MVYIWNSAERIVSEIPPEPVDYIGHRPWNSETGRRGSVYQALHDAENQINKDFGKPEISIGFDISMRVDIYGNSVVIWSRDRKNFVSITDAGTLHYNGNVVKDDILGSFVDDLVKEVFGLEPPEITNVPTRSEPRPPKLTSSVALENPDNSRDRAQVT